MLFKSVFLRNITYKASSKRELSDWVFTLKWELSQKGKSVIIYSFSSLNDTKEDILKYVSAVIEVQNKFGPHIYIYIYTVYIYLYMCI